MQYNSVLHAFLMQKSNESLLELIIKDNLQGLRI